MRKLKHLLVVAMMALPVAAMARCPAGSYEWRDDWGNEICKSFDSGEATSIQGSTKKCPAGTYAWKDDWGNSICKSFDSGQEFHDTSEGCPTGTYEWTDDWGNPVCKKF